MAFGEEDKVTGREDQAARAGSDQRLLCHVTMVPLIPTDCSYSHVMERLFLGDEFTV